MRAEALTRAYQRKIARVAAVSAGRLAATWATLGSYDRSDMPRWSDATSATVQSAQAATAALTAAWLSALVGDTTPGPVPAADLSTPFLVTWHHLSVGAWWEDAVGSGRLEAQTLGHRITHATADEITRASTEGRVTGYRRTLTGASCEWCRGLAGHVYTTFAQASVRHDHCDCTVTPVTESLDVGAVLNRPLVAGATPA